MQADASGRAVGGRLRTIEKVAGAAGFDARIECQNLGGGHDRLNGADLVAGHLGDVVGQLQDGVVLHVLLLLMH